MRVLETRAFGREGPSPFILTKSSGISRQQADVLELAYRLVSETNILWVRVPSSARPYSG